MIISDTKQFVFVHIPKCGGTSVRKLLLPYKTLNEGLGGAIGDHRPLLRLEREYSSLWNKLNRYKSFTIVRRPESRFFSSVMQRLIDFSGIANPTAAEYCRACAADADFLSKHPEFCDWPDDYLHFIPQTAYVFLHNKQIVKRLFPLERPEALIAYLSTELAIETPGVLRRERRSVIARHGLLRGPAQIAKTALRPVLSNFRIEPVKTVLRGIAVKEFSAQQALGPSEHKRFASFAREFYAADYRLWRDNLERSDQKA